MKKKSNIALLIVLLLAMVVALGMAAVLQASTLVDWWRPVAWCSGPALALGLLMARPFASLLRSRSRALGWAAGSVFFFAMLLGGLYTLNFYKSDPSSGRQVEALVADKHTEERHRTRRVGRGRYAQGESYTVYCVSLQLPTGRMKRVEVGAGQYAKLRAGSSMSLRVEDGLLGMPVIKNLRPAVHRARRK